VITTKAVLPKPQIAPAVVSSADSDADPVQAGVILIVDE